MLCWTVLCKGASCPEQRVLKCCCRYIGGPAALPARTWERRSFPVPGLSCLTGKSPLLGRGTHAMAPSTRQRNPSVWYPVRCVDLKTVKGIFFPPVVCWAGLSQGCISFMCAWILYKTGACEKKIYRNQMRCTPSKRNKTQ